MSIRLDDFFSSVVGEPNGWDGDYDALASNLQMMSSEEVKRQLIDSVTKQAEADEQQHQDNPMPASGRRPEQAARKVKRVPTTVDRAGRVRPGTPTRAASVSTSKEMQHLQQENRRLKGKVDELQSAVRQKQEAISGREAQLRRANEELRRAKNSASKFYTEANQRNTELSEAQKLNQQLKAALNAKQAEVTRLTARSEEAARQAADRDTSIASLTQSYQQLQTTHNALDCEHSALLKEYETLVEEHESLKGEHEALLQELEAEINSYTQRKQEILDTQLKTSLVEWSKARNEYQPVPVDHDQLAQVNEVRDQLRKSLIEQTDAFRRNLNDITSAMAKLERTRNAMCEDLDQWQHDLYRANYDRLSLVLQSLDIEIWRTTEARLQLAAQDEQESQNEAIAHWDELIDHLQIVSDYFKGACEVFGLRFFRPDNGEFFDTVRHQPYGSTTAAVPLGAKIATCVAAGVEIKTPDGDTALLRPAIVAVQAS